ncbi:hypothetical protein ACLBWZ_06380 [Brucellaceae bacterium C25G]
MFLGEQSFENVLFKSFWTQEHAHPWPPCFIPLLKYKAGIESYGVLLHPFHSERLPTFVKFFLEEGYLEEVARTEAQFLDLIALESSLSCSDEIELDQQAVELLQRAGLSDHINDIQTAAECTGILEEGLIGYVQGFIPDWPFFCYEYQDIGQYNGQFPTSMTSYSACPFELNYLIAANLVEPVAQFLIEPQNVCDVWLALQAPDTSIAKARDVLQGLKKQYDHPLLDAWLQAAQETEGNF